MNKLIHKFTPREIMSITFEVRRLQSSSCGPEKVIISADYLSFAKIEFNQRDRKK